MKNLSLLLIAVVVAGCSRELPPGQRNNFHPYGVEHAALHFEYFGGNIRGTEDLFIDSFGVREVHSVRSEIIVKDAFQPTTTYMVRTGPNVTVIDSVKHVEVHLLDRSLDSVFRLEGSVPSPEQQFKNTYLASNYHVIGDTMLQGLRAHIWQRAEVPYYIFEWHGIILGNKDGTPDRESELRLVSIDTVTPIDPVRFQVPHTFPVLDLTKVKPGQMPPP